ncbi:glycoside hydrolase family 6 protein [Pseudolysinimonas sp.]|uniref:glycoside hydrolase family 6 protein n=1 Tax=Pseudolysinimonas sp. TaxID=2680009 RepID=UPI003F809B88
MSGTSTTGRRVGVGIVIAVLSLVLAGLAGVAVYSAVAPRPATANPLDGATLWSNPDSSAAKAAADDPQFRPIADEPAATWLTPEQHDASEIGGYVRGLVDEARRSGAWPVLVVYGVPQRDCQAQDSSGGSADDADYRAWVGAIARSLTAQTIVILEPDALALSTQCDNRQQRVAELRSAVGLLARSGATIYLDAGHSGWVAPGDMAQLLRDAGVGQVRGFASNVSNFETTDDERTYDDAVSSDLGGAHYVIDTSRNGNGPTSDQAWCNPPGRGLGDRPRVVEDGTRLDATLWIKNPGESDGSCNGGPPAGQWWPEGAKALIAGGK